MRGVSGKKLEIGADHSLPAMKGAVFDCATGTTLAPLSAAFVVSPYHSSECGGSQRDADDLPLPAMAAT